MIKGIWYDTQYIAGLFPLYIPYDSIMGTLILSNTPVPTWVKHRPTSQRIHVEGQPKYRLWVCPKVGNPIWRIPPAAPKLKLPFECVLDYNTVYIYIFIYIYATRPRPTFCVSDMSLNALSSFLSYQLLYQCIRKVSWAHAPGHILPTYVAAA